MARRNKRNPRPSLPEHIIYDLLLRLPVKSLSRNKLVCKSWLSMISSPDFVNAHLSKSTNDPHFSHHQLILCDAPVISHGFRRYIDLSTRWEDLRLESCPVYSVLDKTVTETVKLDCPMKKVDDWTYVVGSCNGLVCLACYDGRIFLWNPTTRKSRRLPKVPKHKHAHTVFGFGYDESKDDYKVFTIIGDRKYKVSVYSSKSDCWRMIGDFPFNEYAVSRGQLAYGAIHWEYSPAKGKKKIIASLDMKTEAYREILQPKYGKGEHYWTLGTFGKSLSILCQNESGADFWVLKEYGVEETWAKLFNLFIPFDLSCRPPIIPICSCVNGDIMILIDSNISLYNPKKYVPRLTSVWYEDPSDSSFQERMVYTYVESLVSPPAKLKLSANTK